MRLIIVLLFAGLAALCAAEPTTVYRTDYYEVRGTNLGMLMASFRANSPYTNHAYTTWHVDWNYEFDLRPGETSLRSFSAQVQVRYTLPKWVDSAGASPALRTEWKRYFGAVLAHEKGHADLGTKAARRMAERINGQPWRAETRRALKRKLDDECRAILDDFQAQEKAYDKTTDHGRTQGARLQGPAEAQKQIPISSGNASRYVWPKAPSLTRAAFDIIGSGATTGRR